MLSDNVWSSVLLFRSGMLDPVEFPVENNLLNICNNRSHAISMEEDAISMEEEVM